MLSRFYYIKILLYYTHWILIHETFSDGMCFVEADCGPNQQCFTDCGFCYCKDGTFPDANGECAAPAGKLHLTPLL